MKKKSASTPELIAEMLEREAGGLDSEENETLRSSVGERTRAGRVVAMITALECNKQILAAIKQFGTYSYDDKGPEEVMDIPVIVERMSSMNAQQIADVLAEVRGSEYGERFVSTMLVVLQDREDLDVLYDDPRVNDLY